MSCIPQPPAGLCRLGDRIGLQFLPRCTLSAYGPSRHFAMTKRFGRYQAHNRHWGPADSFISVENDPGCVKTLRGIAAPGILGSTVTRRAKKRKNLSSARHYDQIRFRFHTAKTHLGHSPESITKRRGRRNCAPPATSLLAGRREQGGSLATAPQSAGKQCLSRAIASSPLERAIRRVPRPRDSRSM
jgi:hypothetical protein